VEKETGEEKKNANEEEKITKKQGRGSLVTEIMGKGKHVVRGRKKENLPPCQIRPESGRI